MSRRSYISTDPIRTQCLSGTTVWGGPLGAGGGSDHAPPWRLDTAFLQSLLSNFVCNRLFIYTLRLKNGCSSGSARSLQLVCGSGPLRMPLGERRGLPQVGRGYSLESL